jgi:glycosyltransferase involved in cell wall biosynthesis
MRTSRVLRVAIIHDWLNGMRGGEKVLEALLDIFPKADIFTLFYEKEKISDKINSHKIITSSLNKREWIKKRYRSFLPLLPSAVESFDMKDYNLIISSSHCVAKGIIPTPDTCHISYIHSPMRYIWDQYGEYFGDKRGLKKIIIKYFASKLRIWDVTSSARVDAFIANSSFVKKRVNKFYRRSANVIHPPIDVNYFTPKKDAKRNFFLTVSALVPYKRIDLLIRAFNKSKDKLVIVGQGPEEQKLKNMANDNIVFKNDITKTILRDLFRDALAFVFAGVEDFGMVFAEALACGTPVMAYKKGGVLDIIDEGQTGILFENQTYDDIVEAINKIKNGNFDVDVLRKSSLNFSEERFKTKMIKFIESTLDENSGN